MNEAARKAFESDFPVPPMLSWDGSKDEYVTIKNKPWHDARPDIYNRMFTVFLSQQKRIDELEQALSDAIEIAEQYDGYDQLYCNLRFEELKNMIGSDNE